MHGNNRAWLNDLRRSYPASFARCRVLELGSRDVNGSVRDFFDGCEEYVGVDMEAGKGVDVVTRAADMSFQKEHFDTLISFSMLEHDPDWRSSLAHSFQFLKPGAMLFLSFGCEGNRPHEFPVWKIVPQEEFLSFARQTGLEIVDAFVEWDRYEDRTDPGVFDAVLRKKLEF